MTTEIDTQTARSIAARQRPEVANVIFDLIGAVERSAALAKRWESEKQPEYLSSGSEYDYHDGRDAQRAEYIDELRAAISRK